MAANIDKVLTTPALADADCTASEIRASPPTDAVTSDVASFEFVVIRITGRRPHASS
jgi:hypothetical protein